MNIKYLDPDKWNLPVGIKVRGIILFSHVFFLYWLITSFNWIGFAIGLVGYIMVSKIGADIGVHRYFCHRSFKAKLWADWLMLILSIMGGFGSVIHYTVVHRQHHAKSDKPEDPHSPNVTGAFKVWTLQLGDDWETDASLKYVKDLIKDKRQVFLYKHHFKLYLSWVFFVILISLVFGWQWIVYLWAMPTTLAFHTSSALNVICHKWGYQTHNTNDQSTNNTWLNFILLGSALHHNHHAFPTAYSHAGSKWYEFDLWGMVIKYILMEKSSKSV